MASSDRKCPGCTEIAHFCFFCFFFTNCCARGCSEIAHFLFFFKMAAPGRISKEIWQVHQVAVKLHISVFFFVQIAARWVAVKLHISFFFFKMAAPGRIGKEIWQAHQVAVKLHISVFFFFFQISIFATARGQSTAQARNSTRPRLGKARCSHRTCSAPCSKASR